MKRLIAFILISGLALVGLIGMSNMTSPLSDTDMQTVQLANRLYNLEDYEGAVNLYQGLVDSGIRNADVYYNLGNTYFQLEDNGRAILNFTRAQQLQPRDSVINHNLRLAQESADVANLVNNANLFTQLKNIPFTLNEMGLIALLSAFVTVIVWQTRRIIKSTSLKQMVSLVLLVCGIGLAGSVFVLGTRLYQEQSQPRAILLAEATALNVPVGTSVQVLEQEHDRVRVIIPTTSTESWIPLDALEMLS